MRSSRFAANERASEPTRSAFALECYGGPGGAGDEYAAGTELAAERLRSGGRQAGAGDPADSREVSGSPRAEAPRSDYLSRSAAATASGF